MQDSMLCYAMLWYKYKVQMLHVYEYLYKYDKSENIYYLGAYVLRGWDGSDQTVDIQPHQVTSSFP